ncbi:uncharacterized protein NPIL_164441 [Nephila pilipes]|uniref:Uncharacterized protein n=1 Tax=Nephila pilipes TaxID=299642 RepID=A0A8X6Q503_NEPPI|nr:uncharacterized protein NPIL_164441 [Nephila pilipes]
MNKSTGLFKKTLKPILWILHVFGMETIPCPESFRRNKICSFAWNSPKYFFSFLLFALAMGEASWIILFPSLQDEWTIFVVILLSISAHISMVRSRKKFQLLIYKLLRIAKHLGCFHSCKILKSSVLAFYLCMYSASIFFGVMFLFSQQSVLDHDLVWNSTLISEGLKMYGIAIRDFLVILSTVACFGIFTTLTGYYCFISSCGKLFYSELIIKSKTYITQRNYQTILQIYQEISHSMNFADEFLSYIAFILVLSSMSAIFSFTYMIIFISEKDWANYIFIFGSIAYYLIILLTLMLPAAEANQVSAHARDIIISLPGWFPEHYLELTVCICQKYKSKVSLTLWNIYKIEKSLLISALGTLVTYGFLIGNIRIAQGS